MTMERFNFRKLREALRHKPTSTEEVARLEAVTGHVKLITSKEVALTFGCETCAFAEKFCFPTGTNTGWHINVPVPYSTITTFHVRNSGDSTNDIMTERQEVQHGAESCGSELFCTHADEIANAAAKVAQIVMSAEMLAAQLDPPGQEHIISVVIKPETSE